MFRINSSPELSRSTYIFIVYRSSDRLTVFGKVLAGLEKAGLLYEYLHLII